MLRKTLVLILFVFILCLSVYSAPVGDLEIREISATSFSGVIGSDFNGTFKVRNNNLIANYTNVTIIA